MLALDFWKTSGLSLLSAFDYIVCYEKKMFLRVTAGVFKADSLELLKSSVDRTLGCV